MRRRRSARGPPALAAGMSLFLDVDGTLLDIAATPDAVAVPDGLVDTLNALHFALDGAVALVSGRRRADLVALFRGAGVAMVAEHGAAATIPLPSSRPGRGGRVPPPLVAALRRFAARHPDTLLELKRHGAALHVRRSPAAATAARRLAESLADAHRGRVRLLRGKAVFEFVPAEVSKGRAIEALLETPPFRGRTPYVIGDDVTDEDGFAVANRLGGISLRVGPSDIRMAKSAARYTIAGPGPLRTWLRNAADRLSSDKGAARGNFPARRAF
ncbi:MAG: trehalose-phosphatase [Candidatus Odyssella sp.]|nr:trehalose-phosphatase [Candidatus Odyssella sp.]